MARSRTILVAGAGIGGLAAANVLARAGFRPVLIERAPAIQEIGAGIQLTPNATAALKSIGALDLVREQAIEAVELIVGCGDSGRLLARSPIKAAARKYGNPWLLTMRADLQQALYARARENVDIIFEFAADIIELASHQRGITALTTRNRKTEEHIGIGIIGADGLRSKVRSHLHDDGEPDFSGYVAWRTLIPPSKLPDEFSEPNVRLWLSGGAHLVHYPVGKGAMINVVAVFRDAWISEDWNAPAMIADIPKPLSTWAPMPRKIFEAGTEFRRWALADRPALNKWGEGRVTLLGDAAHPMLPFIAQGAGAALEDAEALGRHVKRTAEIDAAFRAYERERQNRTARMQGAARFSGRMYHAGGLLRRLRDFRLGWNSDRLIDSKAWIYRYGAGAP
jgi:salicylate hydroxylase